MFRIPAITGVLAAALVAVMWAAPAQAQATRTWVSGVGDDVNPCSRTAPCKTFPGAISKTAAGGEIDTLDPGGFGAVTVTKAMTIASEGTGEAGIVVAGTNGVTVNCVSDPNCVVILRGLQIDGGPVGSNSLNGVRFIAGRVLEIQNSTIRNFTGGSPNGFGVLFNPVAGTGSVVQQLIITDTTITTNGAGSGPSGTGGAVNVVPTGSGTVNVLFDRVSFLNNTQGPSFNGSGMTGTLNATIANSSLAGSQTGVTTVSTGAMTNITLVRDQISNNPGFGILTSGAQVFFKVGYSAITGNGTSLLNGGASLLSYGNNEIDGNATNTLPATTSLH